MVLSFFFSELRIDVFEQTPSYGFFRLVGKQTRVVNALTTLLKGTHCHLGHILQSWPNVLGTLHIQTR